MIAKASEFCGRWNSKAVSMSLPKKGDRRYHSKTTEYEIGFAGGLYATVIKLDDGGWRFHISRCDVDNVKFDDEKQAMAACESALLFLMEKAAQDIRARQSADAPAVTAP